MISKRKKEKKKELKIGIREHTIYSIWDRQHWLLIYLHLKMEYLGSGANGSLIFDLWSLY